MSAKLLPGFSWENSLMMALRPWYLSFQKKIIYQIIMQLGMRSQRSGEWQALKIADEVSPYRIKNSGTSIFLVLLYRMEL